MTSGIYKIKNKVNNHVYIGSSQNIEKRIKIHINSLKKNKHHSLYLQRAWNKYKESSFTYSIIIKCSPKKCLKLEQYYINILKPEYNTSLDSIAPMFGRKHTKLSKIKMRASAPRLSGKNHHCYGTTLTKEHIEKILKARTGYKHSLKTRRKMSKTSKRLNRYKDLLASIELIKKPVYDSLGRTFSSATEAAIYNKVSPQTCCDILKGRHSNTRKGISFYYA